MKRVLITGASSGIGRQLAIDYARADQYVVACARSVSALEDLVAEYPGKIESLAVDVSIKDEVIRKFSALENIDIGILNAGTCEYVDYEKFDSTLFERVMKVNLFGVVYCIEGLLPKMNQNGQIIAVDSLARLLPFTRSAAYGASKAAVHYLMKSLAVDFCERDIRFQTISPGFVKTPLTDKNDFNMPFLISVEEASREIIAGVGTRKDSISFPFSLSSILRLCSLLPESLQHKMSVYLSQQSKASK